MEYQGFIFTKHAQERLGSRSISKDVVVDVLRYPTETKPTGKQNTTKFIKTVNNRLIHVVATYLNDQNKWLVVSVWVRGEEDSTPLSWQLITFPFKATWWVIRRLIKLATSR
jgi:hypothetical protein